MSRDRIQGQPGAVVVVGPAGVVGAEGVVGSVVAVAVTCNLKVVGILAVALRMMLGLAWQPEEIYSVQVL